MTTAPRPASASPVAACKACACGVLIGLIATWITAFVFLRYAPETVLELVVDTGD